MTYIRGAAADKLERRHNAFGMGPAGAEGNILARVSVRMIRGKVSICVSTMRARSYMRRQSYIHDRRTPQESSGK